MKIYINGVQKDVKPYKGKLRNEISFGNSRSGWFKDGLGQWALYAEVTNERL